MPIPNLEPNGLLPQGVHDCTIHEIEGSFGWNPHREHLLNCFKSCFANEIRSQFSDPLLFDGSFVTDKETPDDIDVILDLTNSTDAQRYRGLIFMRDHQSRLKTKYRVHFWIDLPGVNSFCHFFQYIGIKTANVKGLDPKHLKGILRIV